MLTFMVAERAKRDVSSVTLCGASGTRCLIQSPPITRLCEQRETTFEIAAHFGFLLDPLPRRCSQWTPALCSCLYPATLSTCCKIYEAILTPESVHPNFPSLLEHWRTTKACACAQRTGLCLCCAIVRSGLSGPLCPLSAGRRLGE